MKKQKRLNKLFNLIGQSVMYILFCGTWSAILVIGFLFNTIY
jgi:hypothetical protein